MQSVRLMVDLAEKAGVVRFVLNGSFVTDIMEPNDVDCVLLAAETACEPAAEHELMQGLPFLEILLVDHDKFDDLVNKTFASDCFGVIKGMIEVKP